eukprot:scaffold1335_cov33-Phaeocystis_antarctica.AAC.1
MPRDRSSSPVRIRSEQMRLQKCCGGRTPPFAALLGPDWIRTRRRAPSSSSRGSFSGRRAHALP